MRGGGGHGIEIVKVHDSGCGFVVIAAHENFSQLARAVGHFIRAGAVADDVAEIHDHVERRRGRESGVESFEIGVNVAEKQYAHESPDKLPIIDQVG